MKNKGHAKVWGPTKVHYTIRIALHWVIDRKANLAKAITRRLLSGLQLTTVSRSFQGRPETQ